MGPLRARTSSQRKVPLAKPFRQQKSPIPSFPESGSRRRKARMMPFDMKNAPRRHTGPARHPTCPGTAPSNSWRFSRRRPRRKKIIGIVTPLRPMWGRPDLRRGRKNGSVDAGRDLYIWPGRPNPLGGTSFHEAKLIPRTPLPLLRIVFDPHTSSHPQFLGLGVAVKDVESQAPESRRNVRTLAAAGDRQSVARGRSGPASRLRLAQHGLAGLRGPRRFGGGEPRSFLEQCRAPAPKTNPADI